MSFEILTNMLGLFSSFQLKLAKFKLSTFLQLEEKWFLLIFVIFCLCTVYINTLWIVFLGGDQDASASGRGETP